MTHEQANIGDRWRIKTSTPFQDKETGTPFDPDVVRFEIKAPGLPTAEYIYGEDSNVEKVGVGDYYCDIDVDIPRTWYYHIIGETSEGENQGADQGSFFVKPKKT
jgi:hypothetical protein